MFARGANRGATFFSPASTPSSSLQPHRSRSIYHNMAETMGSVITIDNFSAKMSTFDPNHPENHLYGLVDMGRYSPMPAYSRTSRSNAPK
jgi:hypothetical protein